MTKYFNECRTIEEAKTLKRELLLKFHPDHNEDGLQITKEILNSFESFLNTFVDEAFIKAEKQDEDQTSFADTLNKIIELSMTIEIVGTWIYAYDSFKVKEELKDLGFFFSGKHKAWIFNGGKKKKTWSKMTMNDIKDKYGYSTVKKQSAIKQTA